MRIKRSINIDMMRLSFFSPLFLVDLNLGLAITLLSKCTSPHIMAVPDGAACYFCLGEEADEEGKPLVRDCSCRGDSAGFVHLSCLVNYATQKSNNDGEYIDSFTEPWLKCTNCKQPFQGQLSLDMSSAFVSFAEATYGHADNDIYDRLKIMASLRLEIESSRSITCTETFKLERERTAKKMLSMVDQTKKELKLNSWIHLPHDSEEYQLYRTICINYEGFGYKVLGLGAMYEISPNNYCRENMEIANNYFKKARAIYNLVGMPDEAKKMDIHIEFSSSVIHAAANDERVVSAIPTISMMQNSMLQNSREIYERSLNAKGIDSEDTIRSGLIFAKSLRRDANHSIESERLVTKLATISRRVHGPDHRMTIESDKLLELCKEQRFVIVLLMTKYSRLCDTKMTEKSALSRAP